MFAAEADKITKDFQYRVKTISKKIDMEKAERKKDGIVKQESSKEQE